MTKNSDQAGVRTEDCGDCGEWISVWLIEVDDTTEEGGAWTLSKVSSKGVGTTYANGQAFHGMTCGPR